jgi:hypothetical protein
MGRHLVPSLPGSRRTPRSCPPCEVGPSLPVARRFPAAGRSRPPSPLRAVPAVERELCGHLVLGKRLANNAVRLRGPAFGGGGEEDVRTVGGHGDAVPELTANVVLRLVLAGGLNHLLDLRGAAERDGHAPVTWHGADATASRIRAGRTGRRRLSRGTSPRPGSAASWRHPGTAARHAPPGPGAPRA